MSLISLLVPLRNLNTALHLPLSCFYTHLLFVGAAAESVPSIAQFYTATISLD
jgi:hypothetical protein